MKASVEFALLIRRFLPKTLPLFASRPAGSGEVEEGGLFFCLRSIFPVLSFLCNLFGALTHSAPPLLHISLGCVKLVCVCYSGLVTFSAV